jgi:heavy metal sensor kinase
MAALDRLPIRVRVTLAFAGVMAVVLAGIGLFLYVRLGDELDAAVEDNLRSRAADVIALVEQADSGLAEAPRSPLTERGENLAQILDASGAVLDSTPSVRNAPLLPRADLARARRRTIHVDVPVTEDGARLLATPVHAQGRRLVVVVGAPLDERNDAVANLGGLLLIGGPVALLLASAAGYAALTVALRPVERMRRRAAEIQEAVHGQQLPVPRAGDEIGRLGTTLNDMLARLETAAARERAFVSDASHELRTPLGILSMELDLALRGDRSVEELKAALRSAAEETDRLVQLAQDLLVIARSDSGHLPIRATTLDATEILESVRRRFLRRAETRDIVLDVAIADGTTLLGDRLRLEQAVGNLVDNALRHGGKRIELHATRNGHGVELHVSDDGPGFPADFIGRAFERFTRADVARSRGGTGLGLAIVAAIATSHGGSVGAVNRAEGGADVWLAIHPDLAIDPDASRTA